MSKLIKNIVFGIIAGLSGLLGLSTSRSDAQWCLWFMTCAASLLIIILPWRFMNTRRKQLLLLQAIVSILIIPIALFYAFALEWGYSTMSNYRMLELSLLFVAFLAFISAVWAFAQLVTIIQINQRQAKV